MAAAAAATAAKHKKAKAREEEESHRNSVGAHLSGAGPSEKPSFRPVKSAIFSGVGSGFWAYQKPVGKVYKHTYTEVFVAGLIVGNFATNIMEKTVDPDPDDRKYDALWIAFEYFYNTCFTIELGINMYAFWLKPFWSSGWNVFDFVVVAIGLCTTFKVPLPGPLKLLRMMRAFRVFRLFKRIKSLKKIMDSLAKAVPGVINAFVILVLVMCIYAILGVEFFRLYGQGGFYLNERGRKVELVTARGQDYGWEYFGNFPKSLYTMFQVLTGESWSEVVARPLIHSDDALQSVAYAFFFVSFVVLNAIILINVVVAVLLEKMVDDPEPDPEAEEQETPDQILERCAVDLAQSKKDAGLMKEQLAAILCLLQQPPGSEPQKVPQHLLLQGHPMVQSRDITPMTETLDSDTAPFVVQSSIRELGSLTADDGINERLAPH